MFPFIFNLKLKLPAFKQNRANTETYFQKRCHYQYGCGVSGTLYPFEVIQRSFWLCIGTLSFQSLPYQPSIYCRGDRSCPLASACWRMCLFSHILWRGTSCSIKDEIFFPCRFPRNKRLLHHDQRQHTSFKRTALCVCHMQAMLG